jgi:hypothetical protein
MPRMLENETFIIADHFLSEIKATNIRDAQMFGGFNCSISALSPASRKLRVLFSANPSLTVFKRK